MPDRHVRATGELMGRLSRSARNEVCDAMGLVLVGIAERGINSFKRGDVDAAWSAANEARAITQFDNYCRGYGRSKRGKTTTKRRRSKSKGRRRQP